METPEKNQKKIYYYESLHASNDNKNQSIKPNININLGIRLISKNNKKPMNIIENKNNDNTIKKMRLKFKNKLTPFQKIIKQKNEIKTLNDLKILKNTHFFNGDYALTTTKLSKKLKVNKNKENTYQSNNNMRFSPKEYFNKISNYKSNIYNYNSIKPDLYNYILNFNRRNRKFFENNIKIDDDLTITTPKKKFIRRFNSQLSEELQTTDSGLLNIREQMRYKNDYLFIKTKENIRRNNLLILNKKKFESDINNILFPEKYKGNNKAVGNKSHSNLKRFVKNIYKNKKYLHLKRNNNNNLPNFFVTEKMILSN